MPVNLVHVIPRSFVHKCKAGFDPSYILIRSVFLTKEGFDEGIGIHVSNGFIALLLIYLVCF